ncbi:MAG: ATP-dependent DNA helicase RecG [Bacteroidales bacterium]|jgi:ATP-dependent DNA helicase RecG|nr:ATP-dependent DNA helicase RecG [Bacteroidales bacterium]
MNQILNSEIKYLPGVGPKRAELLEKELNIKTFRDLMYFFPFRYIDRSKIYSISELLPTSSYVQIRGHIMQVKIMMSRGRAGGEAEGSRAAAASYGNSGRKGGGRRLVAYMRDATGTVELVFFKGISYIQKILKPDSEFIAFGKPAVFNGKITMVHPELTPPSAEILYEGSTQMGVYPSTEKLRNNGLGNKVVSKLVRTLLDKCADDLAETLPGDIIARKDLLGLRESLINIHFPVNNTLLSRAQYRLKFEELFYLQLSLLKQRNVRMRSEDGIVMKKVGPAFNKCYESLDFPLTGAQKRVIKEMRSDMCSGRQMNRLLQGDVGSGKTVVAVLLALLAVDNGYQACIMAPTEVLAQQHFSSISKLIKPAGVTVGLLTGSTKKKERDVLLEELVSGRMQILIGTHALIEDRVKFKNLGFAVIDEQHRFGVEQRGRLWNKESNETGDDSGGTGFTVGSDAPAGAESYRRLVPHVLVMTATPIPRTLAMTVFGDLDVSVLDKLPPGRKPITTVHMYDNQSGKLFDFMKGQIKQGRQIFVVYPLITESEKMDYKNLEEGYDVISEVFKAPEYVTTVVHGRQKPADKEFGMKLFASGKADIMVSTSVIEVGVDVPNASVMIIESAERFGLSQLHQLRGRVGRGSDKSYCVLVTGYKLSEEGRKRIEMMCETQDGFRLAEADMKMRGPGDMEGTAQSGLAFDLHIANLALDSSILENARHTAMHVLDSDPLLSGPASVILRRELETLRNYGKEPVDYGRIS